LFKKKGNIICPLKDYVVSVSSLLVFKVYIFKLSKIIYIIIKFGIIIFVFLKEKKITIVEFHKKALIINVQQYNIAIRI